MFDSLSLGSAFLLGMLGSAHCIGMCGGIASSIALTSNANKTRSLLFYNFGRISSYAAAGAILGSLDYLFRYGPLESYLRLFAALMLIAMGLYVAQWWRGLTKIEAIGHNLWRFISPAASKLLPVNNLRQAFSLGIFWGWLPCGLVYSTLIWSSAANSSAQSAMLMLFFGLGTVPAMMTTSLLAKQLKGLFSKRISQQISGAAIIVFGLYSVPWRGLISIFNGYLT
ncbi:MAG: membrane protein, putative [Osedax symbiont Rs2]|nr:MAG: membrane protein, putative [Osedax symbiont Rs2]